ADFPSKSPRWHCRDGLLYGLNRWFPSAARVVRSGSRTSAAHALQRHSEPTAPWLVQQLREAFRSFGTEPVRTAYRSPWQKGIAERWVGTCRRELLDHVVVLNERHLHRRLREYVAYYNGDRVHTWLRDAPERRPLEPRPSHGAKVVGRPRVGGLHHRYV